MYIFPYYCAYCGNGITEIVVRSATVVHLSCNSCRTKYYQCRYCNTETSCHKKYFVLNHNHSRNTKHKKNVRNKRIRDTLGVLVAPVRMEVDDNEVQDHIDFPVNNNDDNDVSNASLVEESTIEAARKLDFDYNCVNDYFGLLKVHSDEPTPTDMDGILRHHKNYHHSSILGEGPNSILNTVMGEKLNTSKQVGTYWNLLLSYMMKKLPNNVRPLLAAMLTFQKYETQYREDCYIPITNADIRRELTEGKHSVYKNLPCPPVDSIGEGYAYVSLYDIIEFAFSDPKNVPSPLLPLPTSPHGETPRGKELLTGFIENKEDAIKLSVYPVEIILWTDAFMPHNVVIKNCKSVHTCTATIGRPNGNRSGKFSHPVWLGPKDNDRSFVEKRLVEEINKLSTQGMQVYHPVLKRIVLVTLKLYVFLADRPDKSDLLDVLSSKFCSRFGYAGDMSKIMDKVVCCKTCYKKLSTPSTDTSGEGCEDCFNLDFSRITYETKEGKYPHTLLPDGEKIMVLPMKKLTFDGMEEAVIRTFDMVAQNEWTQVKAKYYLQTEGIKTSLADRCIKHANNCFKLREHRDNSPDYEELYQEYTDFREEFEIPNFPAVWELVNTVDSQIFIDACMHLLFLGGMKALASTIIPPVLKEKKKTYIFR